MKHLNSLYQLLLWMGMCENHKSGVETKVLSWILVSIVILNQFVFLIIPCSLAVYAARSNNAEAFDVIMMVIGSLIAVGSVIGFAAVRSKALAVFRQINDMIDTSKSK